MNQSNLTFGSNLLYVWVKLFGGTIPPNNFFGGGTLMEISFWYGKGDIPNENFRLPPLEVHFGIGGCGRTDSAGGAGQE